MVRKIILVISALVGLSIMTGIDVHEEDQYEEYLEIQVHEKRVLAFFNGKPSAAVDLEMGENVLDSEEKGFMGAVLTDRRFLAISSTSGKWLSEPLDAGEENSGHLRIGEEIVMLITNRRIIGFTLGRDEFREYDFQAGKIVLDKDAGENFGIVVMSDKAVGLSSGTGNFNEIEFGISEFFKSMEMAVDFVVIDTNKNIYTYRGLSGTWSSRPREPL